MIVRFLVRVAMGPKTSSDFALASGKSSARSEMGSKQSLRAFLVAISKLFETADVRDVPVYPSPELDRLSASIPDYPLSPSDLVNWSCLFRLRAQGTH